jgi:hypothetical protein
MNMLANVRNGNLCSGGEPGHTARLHVRLETADWKKRTGELTRRGGGAMPAGREKEQSEICRYS